MPIPRDLSTLGFLAVSALVLLWDVFLAGQIAQARRQSPLMLALTALCGLFIAPAILIAILASTILTARTIHLVTWIWPLTLTAFVLQSGIAVVRRLVTPLVGVPIFAFNAVLLAAAVSRFAMQFVADPPSPLVAFDAAEANALGLLLGRTALSSPLAVLLPLLSPAYPARWRISKSIRALLGMVAAAGSVLVAIEYPRAVRAAQTFSAFTNERLQERPLGDFALGMRLFPSLRGGGPPPLALDHDLALADTLDVAIVSVVIDAEGTTGLALDSLANSLDDLRRDSVALVVSLGYGLRDRDRFRDDPAAYSERRLAMVDRVIRRVRPDVILPALDPYDAGRRTLGPVAAEWWRDYLLRAAQLSHSLRPRTRVAVTASAFTDIDSALFAWASNEPTIDLVGFSFEPSYGGGVALAARLRIAERWLRNGRKDAWVFAARAYPQVYGDANQERAIWGTLSWATSQPRVRALIVDGAGDYDALTGMRAPGGRLRPVVAAVNRARRALEEAAR